MPFGDNPLSVGVPAGIVQGTVVSKMIMPGGQSFSLGSLGVFTGQIGGPFGLKPKQSFMTAQMDYERQVLANIKSAGDQLLAQNVSNASAIYSGPPIDSGGSFASKVRGPSSGGFSFDV